MFEIGLTIGWASLMRENRREHLRSSFGGRTSESYPNFQDEARQEKKREKKEEPKQTSSLNKSEEQLLKEVLTEFLG